MFYVMYTRKLFGKELKERLDLNQDALQIAAWSYKVYLGEIDDESDAEFIHILLILNCMENGEEFIICNKRLYEIADDLMSGKKNINMDY